MGEMPQVVSVAPDSPAARAGIQIGDNIAAIDGVPIAKIKANTPDPALLSDALLDQFSKVPEGHTISISVIRGTGTRDLKVTAQRVCAGKAIVETTGGLDLQSDARNVAIGTDTIAGMHNDDELALLLGHEYGHVIDHHRDLHNVTAIRQQEEQADLLGMALAKCAGYDVGRGLQFWVRFRERPFGWIFSDPTHGSVKDRIARMRAALPAVQCPLSRYADGTLPAAQIGYSRPTDE